MAVPETRVRQCFWPSTSLLLAKVGSRVASVLRTIFMANLLCPHLITGVFPTQKAPRGLALGNFRRQKAALFEIKRQKSRAFRLEFRLHRTRKKQRNTLWGIKHFSLVPSVPPFPAVYYTAYLGSVSSALSVCGRTGCNLELASSLHFS